MWGAVGTGFISGGIATGSLKGALVGAFSGAAFYGIGQQFKALSNGNIDKWNAASAAEAGSIMDGLHTFGGIELTSGQIAGQIASHAATGGVTSALAGGKFGHGFFSAGVTKGIGGTYLPGGNNLVSGQIAKGAFISSVIGGTTSVISGGKFANGAKTGAFQYLFNQAGNSLKNMWNQTRKNLDILRYESKKQFKEWAVNVDLSKGLANGARVAGWASSIFVVIPGGQPIAGGFALASLGLSGASNLVDAMDGGTFNGTSFAGTASSGTMEVIERQIVPLLPKQYQIAAQIGFNAYDRVTSEMFGLASQ
jgi:hypothetical protein